MTLLVTPADIKSICFQSGDTFSSNVFTNVLIQRAQEDWIRPCLGDDFYEVYLLEIAKSIPDPNYTYLNTNFIQIALAHFVILTGLVKNYIKITDIGLGSNDFKYVTKTDISNFKMVQRDFRNVGNSFLRDFTKYIQDEDNIVNFPDYDYTQNVMNYV